MVVQNIAFTALLLGVLVFVHEFGHFLVAKACGVKVLKFSIGFGPRIVGFTRGDTEYCIAWLPLGGYVKMAGELSNDELPPEEVSRGFLSQAPWKRALIVAAGPFFNLIFPILVYFFVFVGTHKAWAPTVGSVEAGTPAQAVLLPGDRVLAVDGEAVRTFDEMRREVAPKFDRELTLLVDRAGKQVSVHVTPLRETETNPIESIQRGSIGINAQAKPAVLGVPVGSPAETAGLKTFDHIVELNGQPVRTEGDLEKALLNGSGPLKLRVEREGTDPKKPDVVSLTLERQPGMGYAAMGGEAVDTYVYEVAPGSPVAKAGMQKGDRILSFNGKPVASFRMLSIALSGFKEKQPFQLGWRHGTDAVQAQVELQKKEVKDEIGNHIEQLELGIVTRLPKEGEVPDIERVDVYHSPIAALSEALEIVPEIIAKTAMVIGMLITGRVPFGSVGGPLLAYQLVSKTAEAGLDSFLNLMAIISINLGLMNLLPIPVLDGFQLLASIWEGVRRRPIPTRAREIANAVGLVMLVILMILVFNNDLRR